MAVAAPPEPRTTNFLLAMSTPCSFKLRTKPIPSVMWPVNLPLSFTITLTAPIILAAGDNSSTKLAATVLQGMVTLLPRTLNNFNASIALGMSSFFTSKAK